MRFLFALIVFIMALTIMLFAINNVGTTVPVTLIATYPNLQLIVVVFCSIAFGALFVGVVAIAEGAKARFENRRLRREVHRLDAELNFLRIEPRSVPDSAAKVVAQPAPPAGGSPRAELPSAPVYNPRGRNEDSDPDDDMYAGERAV